MLHYACNLCKMVSASASWYAWFLRFREAQTMLIVLVCWGVGVGLIIICVPHTHIHRKWDNETCNQ